MNEIEPQVTANHTDQDDQPSKKPSALGFASQISAGMAATRPDGLPTWRSLLWFPLATFLLMAILVVLGISGTSSGIFWTAFGPPGTTDPSLITGSPRIIRSDEYYSQTGWLISQEKQSHPALSQSFPGGWNATLHQDLPTKDWSAFFRPHLGPMLFIPFEAGVAWRWWFPLWLMAAGAFIFVRTLAPRQPFLAVCLAAVAAYSPIVQWFFLAVTILPIAFCFLAMAGVWWAFRTHRAWERWLWGAIAAYAMVATTMSIYVPYIVPMAWLWLIFACCAAIQCSREHLASQPGGLSIAARAQKRLHYCVQRLWPMATALGVGLVVIIGWFFSRHAAIAAVLNTKYPGARRSSTGTFSKNDTLSLFAAPFNTSFKYTDAVDALGANASEASTPFLIAVFLAIPITGTLVYQLWARRRIDWLLAACLLPLALTGAYFYIPGWSRLADFLGLGLTTDGRMKLIFVPLGVLAVVVLYQRVLKSTDRPPHQWLRVLGWGAVGAVIVTELMVLLALIRRSGPLLTTHSKHDVEWILAGVLFAMAIGFLVFSRLRLGAACLAVTALITGFGVNPLYRGVFDLSETAIGQAVTRIDQASPGNWIGIGDMVYSALLIHSSVVAYNGFQTYPAPAMWHQIDQDGTFEVNWNRLANIGWKYDEGPVTIQNPAQDQILVTFDPCSQFAQTNVKYVLSDQKLPTRCLRPREQLVDQSTTAWIYEVVRTSN